eukprot:TRINITY_DN10287_c0_g1_i1.p1 TRINITY_DN10287_c0_g1~~TRINITY_DN10287_c0_g1_i1.p1  ORF type:complete len:499 (+),score=112.01 TRINITY_DN10287_c0_g1_i1:118-1614(+)
MASAQPVLKIGQYRIGKTLGMGSFGKVKLAVHEVTNQKVAIKILNRKKVKNLEMNEKIRREVQILTNFAHPHIIRLYEVIETPTDLFLVMEYVPNGELFEYIVSSGRLPEETARRFFQQIIFAVNYCHQHNVVHRDLKPENLLLDAGNDVKIADFGLSNFLNDGDFLKTSCGSPNYAAPEVISGNLYCGPEVDVWSCGVILYALLCGRLPFDDELIPNLFKKIKSGLFHLPGYLSDQSRDLISRMLVVNPLERYTIDDIRSHPWFHHNIPSYLPASLKDTKETVTLDKEVLESLAKTYGITVDVVMECSKHKRHDDPQTHQVSIAYQLMHDQKLKLIIEKAKRNPQGSGSSTPLLTGEDALPDFASLPNSQLRLVPLEKAPLRPPTHGRGPAPIIIDDPAKKKGWYAGIRCSRHPADIMVEIYRNLSVLHCEWKTVSPFEVRARCFRTTHSQSTLVRMAFKLYRIGESKYLLDVQRLEGPSVPFMEISSNILSRIQVA